MTSSPRISDYLVYGLARLGIGLIRILPVSVALAFGRALGLLWYGIDRRHRETAVTHLQQILGLSPQESLQLARRVFCHFGMVVVEVFKMRYLINESNWHQFIRIDPEQLKSLRPGKEGIIMVSGHLGNWELVGAVLGYAGIKTASVARPIDNPLIDRHLTQARESMGQKIIPKREAFSALVSWIKAGNGVALLIDQDAGSDGIFVDFLGRPASTTPAAAVLARLTGAPIMVGVAYREKGFCYRVVMEGPFPVARTSDRKQDMRNATDHLSRFLEARVRQHPEQWIWMHRRWKTKPPAPASIADL